MSREEFKNFHNILIKEKLLQCKKSKEIVFRSKNYGYTVTLEDINYDKTATQFELGFNKSKINPFK